MEAKKQTPKTAAPKTAKGAPFCLRLNTLRALSAVSVICTHIVSYLSIRSHFYSLHVSGHVAVYFFFSLSGYLSTLNLIKEVKRRLSEDKSQSKSRLISKSTEEEAKELTGSQPPQIQIDLGEEKKSNERSGTPESPWQMIDGGIPLSEITVVSGKEETMNTKKRGEFLGITLLKTVKKSPLVCMICKFFWNRTWRLFPLYYVCCTLLKIADIKGRPDWTQLPITWEDIFLLANFPNQLWTMRVEMKYSYFVLPIYMSALYGAFKLQKNGYEKASKCAFAAIVLVCLFIAIFFMVDAPPVPAPVFYSDKFWWSVPPFFWGMLMGLLNYRLDLEFNKHQAASKAKAKALAEAEKKENGEAPIAKDQRSEDSFVKRVAKYVLSVLYQHRYTIIFYAALIRIAFFSFGFGSFFTQNYDIGTRSYALNYHSHWLALFVLINDSRGGFWKFMHTQPEPKPTTLHPTDFHRLVYYFGLWSYIIYLIHPVVYYRLALLVGSRAWSVEYAVVTIFLCLLFAGIIDLVVDKMLVNKIILGKIVPSIGNIFTAKKITLGQDAPKTSS